MIAANLKTPFGFRMPPSLSGARRPINTLLRNRLLAALCTPHHVDGYLELIDPTWSVREVRARIVGVEPEADCATSLFLRPNENWRGFRAGQFVSLSVRTNGVRYTRCFSISSAPEDGLPIRLTIKAFPSGKLGAWAARGARRGQVVELTQAHGDFVLPNPLPERVLFIGGGSGITPIASMIRHLLATRYRGELTCLHYARDAHMFASELSTLAERNPSFRYMPVLTRASVALPAAATRHFSIDHLETMASRWAESEIFMCGPTPLQNAVATLLGEHGLATRLHRERFVTAAAIPESSLTRECRITFTDSGRAIRGDVTTSLLEQAERAGLQPKHGCRMGVCHSCKCRKLSGVVRNALTGELSTEPDDEIQLCVSTPRSDVALAL